MTIAETIQFIKGELPTGVVNNITAQKIRESILSVVDLFGVTSFGNLEYDDQEIYDQTTNPYATLLSRLWEARENNFSGQSPPTDPNVNQNFYWTEISQNQPSSVREWMAGAYGDGLQVVIGSIDGQRSWVELVNPNRPYVSVDLQAEFDGGDWELIGGAGGGGDTVELQGGVASDSPVMARPGLQVPGRIVITNEIFSGSILTGITYMVSTDGINFILPMGGDTLVDLNDWIDANVIEDTYAVFLPEGTFVPAVQAFEIIRWKANKLL